VASVFSKASFIYIKKRSKNSFVSRMRIEGAEAQLPPPSVQSQPALGAPLAVVKNISMNAIAFPSTVNKAPPGKPSTVRSSLFIWF
jgi:hypothetical protein